MRKIAQLPENDRRDLFMATAEAMRVHQAIIEKDFWVCWVLDYLFGDSKWKNDLAFKGGTSLSKAYGAIERFSEDIDLILDWKLLGYEQDEPWMERSTTQQNLFGEEANRRTVTYLKEHVVPVLRRDLATRAGMQVGVDAVGQDIFIAYPRAFSLEAIQPQVRLEIGPLAESNPSELREIRPFAAERFPSVFTQPTTHVQTLSAERTFWEKATILHQEAHRGAEKVLPPRYSRHYYDLYKLSCLPIRQSALRDFLLLERVVRHKMKFYRCPWAHYEESTQGNLRLLPPDHHIGQLRRDYSSMQAMVFGDIPEFERILEGLSSLETEINNLNRAPQP